MDLRHRADPSIAHNIYNIHDCSDGEYSVTFFVVALYSGLLLGADSE